MYSKIVVFGVCFLMLLEHHRTSGEVCPDEVGDKSSCGFSDSCETVLKIIDATTGRGSIKTFGYASCASVPYRNRIVKLCCPTELAFEDNNDQNYNNNDDNNNNADNNDNNNNNKNYNENSFLNNKPKTSNYGPLYPPVCGTTDATFTKVVNGVPASLGNWPWATALGYRGIRNPLKPIFKCGGALISTRHVLTAAHCIDDKDELYLVRVGELDLEDDYDGATPIDLLIEKKTIHPLYNGRTYSNDIAVLKFERDIEFTDLIKPLCLPITEDIQRAPKVNQRPFIIGWGALHFGRASATTLQQAQLPLIEQDLCKEAYKPRNVVINDRVLCTGLPDSASDACQGDSGGSLMYPLGKTWYSIGVISYSYQCALSKWPTVYTKTQKFLDFILQNLN